ncbi:hypothetical protein BD779DRAFT_1478393 [Infundibulicybe gibba]|nr:hypothetical protein BD779DRAFT_1478393 [Infundibulicybe gibba]
MSISRLPEPPYIMALYKLLQVHPQKFLGPCNLLVLLSLTTHTLCGISHACAHALGAACGPPYMPALSYTLPPPNRNDNPRSLLIEGLDGGHFNWGILCGLFWQDNDCNHWFLETTKDGPQALLLGTTWRLRNTYESVLRRRPLRLNASLQSSLCWRVGPNCQQGYAPQDFYDRSTVLPGASKAHKYPLPLPLSRPSQNRGHRHRPQNPPFSLNPTPSSSTLTPSCQHSTPTPPFTIERLTGLAFSRNVPSLPPCNQESRSNTIVMMPSPSSGTGHQCCPLAIEGGGTNIFASNDDCPTFHAIFLNNLFPVLGFKTKAAYFLITFLALCTRINKGEGGSPLNPKLTTKLTLLVVGWSIFALLCYRAAGAKLDNKVYNPFEILELSSSSMHILQKAFLFIGGWHWETTICSTLGSLITNAMLPPSLR